MSARLVVSATEARPAVTPDASISSMKTDRRSFAFACSKGTHATGADADELSTKSTRRFAEERDSGLTGDPHGRATSCRSGGPYEGRPSGSSPPSPGTLRRLEILLDLLSSSTASSRPATSAK